MTQPCPICPCAQEHPAHAMHALLQANALGAALDAGLLDIQPCPGCSAECQQQLIAARDARRIALAARARYRQRNLRLARIKAEREAARKPATPPLATTPITTSAPPSAGKTSSALPNAASAALARALAKAKERHS